MPCTITGWPTVREGAGTDGRVTALAVYDNRLIAGGHFLTAGGVEANYIAEWYGAVWSPLGSGLDGPVNILCAWDTSLYVGGSFLTAGAHSSPYFARWDRFLGTPTAVDDDPDGLSLPQGYVLSQNYPNPFNPMTEISFSLPRASEVRLDVYNVLGQIVSTMYQGRLAAGCHIYSWVGSHCASGVYFYRLTAGDFVETRKMVLLK